MDTAEATPPQYDSITCPVMPPANSLLDENRASSKELPSSSEGPHSRKEAESPYMLANQMGQASISDRRESRNSRRLDSEASVDLTRTKTNTLNEYLLSDEIMAREIQSRFPEILQLCNFAKLKSIKRKEKFTEGKGTRRLRKSSIERRPSGRSSSPVFSPLNCISPPPIVVEHRESSKTPPKSTSSFFTRKSNPPLPDMTKPPIVPAASFFESYEVTRIGPYILTKTLGTGSTSKVKLGIHFTTGEKIAVKIIPREPIIKVQESDSALNGNRARKNANTFESNLAKESRLQREITLLSLLYHPHITTLYGYAMTPSCYILFMEYVEGGPLLNYVVKHRRLKEDHAREFFRQLLSAVKYLHENNVVHRDLKIENILIDSDGNLKIIDFGLSNFYVSSLSDSSDSSLLVKLSTFCGSLYYAAPELLHGRPYFGPEVDVWSLGVILYVLVSGKVPFDDEKLPMLHQKIKEGHVNYPSFLNTELVSLLKTMLVVNPTARATIGSLCSSEWVNSVYEAQVLSVVQSSLSATIRVKLPPVSSLLPRRMRLVCVDDTIVLGVFFVLGKKYSPWMLRRIYQHAILDWDLFKDNPLIKLYYLVEEKFSRYNRDMHNRKFDGNYVPGKSLSANPSVVIPSESSLLRYGRMLSPPTDTFHFDHKQSPSKESSNMWLKSFIPSAIQSLMHPFRPVETNEREKASYSLSTSTRSDSPSNTSSNSLKSSTRSGGNLKIDNIYWGKLVSNLFLIRPSASSSAISLKSKEHRYSSIPNFVLYKDPLELEEDLIRAFALLGLKYQECGTGLLCVYSPSLDVVSKDNFFNDSSNDSDSKTSYLKKMEIRCDIVKLFWTSEHAIKFKLLNAVSPSSSAEHGLFRKIVQEIIKACSWFCNERLEQISTIEER